MINWIRIIIVGIITGIAFNTGILFIQGFYIGMLFMMTVIKIEEYAQPKTKDKER